MAALLEGETGKGSLTVHPGHKNSQSAALIVAIKKVEVICYSEVC